MPLNKNIFFMHCDTVLLENTLHHYMHLTFHIYVCIYIYTAYYAHHATDDSFYSFINTFNHELSVFLL